MPELKDDKNKMFVLHNCSYFLMATPRIAEDRSSDLWLLSCEITHDIITDNEYSKLTVQHLIIKIEPKTRKTFSQSIGSFTAKKM